MDVPKNIMVVHRTTTISTPQVRYCEISEPDDTKSRKATHPCARPDSSVDSVVLRRVLKHLNLSNKAKCYETSSFNRQISA